MSRSDIAEACEAGAPKTIAVPACRYKSYHDTIVRQKHKLRQLADEVGSLEVELMDNNTILVGQNIRIEELESALKAAQAVWTYTDSVINNMAIEKINKALNKTTEK